MNKNYYIYLLLGFILTLSPYPLCASSFEISDPSIDSSFKELVTSDNAVINRFLDWEYMNNSNGINNFQKKISKTQSKAYKGISIFSSPIETIYAIITDVNNHPKWVKFCKSSQTIGKQDPSKSTQYYQFDIPWPFSNRDVVVNSTTKIDWDSGKITISSTAADHSKIPQKNEFIRVVESSQKWTLERITSTTTRVTFTSHTPLCISDSELLKKMVSTTIPFSTLESLKKLSSQKFKESGSKRCVVKSDSDSILEKELKAGS